MGLSTQILFFFFKNGTVTYSQLGYEHCTCVIWSILFAGWIGSCCYEDQNHCLFTSLLICITCMTHKYHRAFLLMATFDPKRLYIIRDRLKICSFQYTVASSRKHQQVVIQKKKKRFGSSIRLSFPVFGKKFHPPNSRLHLNIISVRGF